MELERCPNCKEAAVVLGSFSENGFGFLPDRARLLRSRQRINFTTHKARACVTCGHVWSSLNPASLRDFIREHTAEIDRQHLDEIDHGPFRDLPDTELARALGAKVQEIDALARTGRWGKAVRRYRDMQGVTWDQAHKDMSNWTGMLREDKLALFGWVSKKKGPIDELA